MIIKILTKYQINSILYFQVNLKIIDFLMEDDMRENIAKIISAKTKQIKIQADKYEGQIKAEVAKIIILEDSIKLINKKSDISHDDKELILSKKNEIKEIKKHIKILTKEKHEVLGCEINIGFVDDHYIKNDLDF